jgi:hypothetical protein
MVTILAAVSAFAFGQPVTTVEITPPTHEAWASVAERSKFEATSLHADVVAVLDQMAKDAPEVARRASMGTSVEGRDLPVLILSDPPVATAAEAKALAEKEGRAIVFLFGNIHAGEVDAKEAYLILARELIEAHPKAGWGGPIGPDGELLEKLVVVIAPIYNADGNERIGPNDVNRPGQDGPALGMGIRHNAMDLDLNRDWGKLESPEARGIVRFLVEWDPHVVVDGHTTDGSYQRNLMTYATPKALAGDERLNEYARQMLPKIGEALRLRTDIDSLWYGDFEGEHENPPRTHEQWTTTPGLPRYSTHYVGMRGRIGILSESYSYSTYKARIVGSLEFAREILRYSAAHAAEIRRVTGEASEWGAGKNGQGGSIDIRTKDAPSPLGKVLVKGYVEKTKDGRAMATNEPKDYECVLIDRLEPVLSVSRPLAYVFTHPVPKVIENLRLHGVVIESVEKETTFDVEEYTIDSVKKAEKQWQGHVLVTVEATAARKRITVASGAAMVRTDQALGNLVCYWLEPQCEDGLTTWNFFDEWCEAGKAFPVVRVLAD